MRGLHDYHTHTYLSGHGEGVPTEYARRAVAIGLDEIGMSEHIPMYWLPEARRDPTLAPALAQVPLYFALVEEARRAVPDLTIRQGLEADYIAGHEDTLRGFLAAYEWDYVYGSVHFIGDWGMDDARYMDEYDRRDINMVYEEYFALVEAAARTGLFDIMGHLDLVKKFGHRATMDLGPLYRRVAATLAASGVCVEINTAGLLKPVAEIYPQVDLLRALYAVGVPVSLGSDAHQPHLVGFAFDQALALLREVGYDRLVRFRGRARAYAPLP